MLGIDYTLLSLSVSASELENICSLAIELRDLQAAYISISKKSPSHSSNGSLTSNTADYGCGVFVIIEKTDEFIEDVVNSTVSIKATVLANGNRSALYSYASGEIGSISQVARVAESCISGGPESPFRSEIDPNFLQKLRVFGESSILAYFPKVTIDLVYSFGVSSIAGSVSFSIAIIDLSKAKKGKIIESTDMILQDLPRKIPNKLEEIIFDMDGFLNQAPRERWSAEEIVKIEHKEPVTELAKAILNLEDSDGVDEERIISSSAEKLDEHFDSDGDSSVSIDGFLDEINGRRALCVQLTELATNEAVIDKKESRENIDILNLPKVVSSFCYPVFDKMKPKGKVITQVMRRTPALVGYALDRPPPSALTQDGIRVHGRIAKKNGNMKAWDSAPMTRQDYTKKTPLKKSNNQKSMSKLNDKQIESVTVIDTSKGDSTATSPSPSTSSSQSNSIDNKLLFASHQIIQVSVVKVVDGTQAGRGCDKEKNKILPQNTRSTDIMAVTDTATVADSDVNKCHSSHEAISMNDMDIATEVAPGGVASEEVSCPHDVSYLSD